MLFGDDLRVTESGIHVRENVLQRIGISRNSVCWGVWVLKVPDVRPYDVFAQRPFEKRWADDEIPHLLVSPIHPRTWPFVFHLLVKLRRDTAAMSLATEILRKEHNILFAECTPSGHSHATWNVIGEATMVSNSISADLADLDTSNGVLAKALLVRREMLASLVRLRDSMIQSNTRTPFLHSRYVDRSDLFSQMSDGGELPGELGAEHERLLIKSVTFHLMQNLCYFWMAKNKVDPVLELRFDGDSRVLRPLSVEDAKSYRQCLDDLVVQLPTRAIASFDSDEHYARLALLRAHQLRRLVVVEVGYRSHVDASDDGPTERHATQGLQHEVTTRIHKHGYELIRTANMIDFRDSSNESGKLSFLAMNSGSASDGDSLLKKINAIDLPKVAIAPTIRPHRPERVFVSLHSKLPRDDIRQKIDDAAHRAGFEEAVFSQTYTTNPDDNVAEDLRRCECFLQIATKSEPSKDGKEDNAWLIAEHFAARALRKIMVRMIEAADEAEEAHWREKLRLGQDRASIPFDLRKNDIEEKLNKAMEHLVRGIEAVQRSI